MKNLKIKDQLNRSISLKEIPKRIISLVPSQTELLVYLGLENSIVGITKFCVHPNNLKTKKTIVGGTKQVDFSVIQNLQPDIILCNKEENTKEIVSQLEEISPVHISDICTIKNCLELIKLYGSLFKVEEKADFLVEGIQKERSKFNHFIKKEPSLKVAYFIWKNPFMVAGNNTFINELLKANNFENIFSELNRYPEIKPTKSNEQPDLVLLSSEPFPFKEKHILEFQKIYPKAKVLLVDGEYFSWYGSRILKAFSYFKLLRNNL